MSLPVHLPSSAVRWTVATGAALALAFSLLGVTDADGRVLVNPTRVVAGQTVSVTGSGWAPHDQILVSFTDAAGNLLPLGVVVADASGSFQQTIVVPTTIAPGTYQIDGNGQGGSVSVKITIIAPTPANVTPTAGPAPPTAAASETATPTPSPTSTSTPTVTPTATFTPTSTPTPTNTPTLPERLVATGRGAGSTRLIVVAPLVALAVYAAYRHRRG